LDMILKDSCLTDIIIFLVVISFVMSVFCIFLIKRRKMYEKVF
jgi:hypothetical protein